MGIGVTFFTEAVGAGPRKDMDILGLVWPTVVSCEFTRPARPWCDSRSRPRARVTRRRSPRSSPRRSGFQPEDIDVVHGDTDNTPFGLGTYGSRSTPVSGAAAALVARKVKDKAQIIASGMLEVSVTDLEWVKGSFHVKGDPSKSVTIQDIAMKAHGAGDLPEGLEGGLEAQICYNPENLTYPFGAYICVVDIDPGTAEVKVRRFIAVDDCGTQINPMIIEGQVHGGLADGIGMALMEMISFDEDGNCLGGSLMDYLIPTALETPDWETGSTVTPSPHHPIGAKGIGESATVGSPAAVVNAVMDALKPFGVRHADMPLTPSRLGGPGESALIGAEHHNQQGHMTSSRRTSQRVTELVSMRVPFALATVVRAEMPTSARPGDAAIILADGSVEGFVGGQCAEESVKVAAMGVLSSGEPLLLRVLPAEEEGFPERPGAQAVVNPCLSGGAIEVFLEPKLPAARISIVGNTPIAEALVQFGEQLGYDVDHQPNGVPDTTGSLAVLISSHGRHEEDSIRAALDAQVGFVGLVASRVRGATVIASLELNPDQAAVVRSPVGIEIGARTAEEVALSVLADLTREVRRNGLVAPKSQVVEAPAETIDPICGMTVIVGDQTPHLHHDNADYWAGAPVGGPAARAGLHHSGAHFGSGRGVSPTGGLSLRRRRRPPVLVRSPGVRRPRQSARRQGGVEAARIGPLSPCHYSAVAAAVGGQKQNDQDGRCMSAFETVESLIDSLNGVDYLVDEGLATALFLAQSLGQPLLLEGEPGVGKTAAARAMAAALDTPLLRLQCYEGIAANEALYEWNYPRQLLAIRMSESDDGKLTDDDLFTDEYLVERPLLAALRHQGPVPPVVLIDEIDRADDEFEALLFEFLGEQSISIPELGTITCSHAADRRAYLEPKPRAARCAQTPVLVFDLVFEGDALPTGRDARRATKHQPPSVSTEEQHRMAVRNQVAEGAGGVPWSSAPSAAPDEDESPADEDDIVLPELLPASLAQIADEPFDHLSEVELAEIGAWLEAAAIQWPRRPVRRRKPSNRPGQLGSPPDARRGAPNRGRPGRAQMDRQPSPYAPGGHAGRCVWFHADLRAAVPACVAGTRHAFGCEVIEHSAYLAQVIAGVGHACAEPALDFVKHGLEQRAGCLVCFSPRGGELQTKWTTDMNNKLSKLILALAMAVLVGVMALPGVAQAQEAGDVTVEGRGWLAARGTGDVDIDMGGRIRLHVEGDVVITDHAGDMRVRFRSAPNAAEEERTGNVVLTDHRGAVGVVGTDFSISVNGKVVLKAHGRGQANLVGEGTYRTRNGDRTVWDGMVQIGDPQVQPAG
ncbi:Carbon monoxide dehydrogenase large chain [Nymphon striatum]|nr:Carbon monoxide dehydrogenase large chain [Nymphon striatum]